MAEAIDFEARFRDIAVHEAAQDTKLRGTLEWLHLGYTLLIPTEIAETTDHADLSVDIAEKYSLTEPEDVERAFQICEDQIMQEASGGQA